MPNAFATGRNPKNSAIAVTEGLLDLEERELTGVIAHEMGHIKNRDILIQTLAAVLAGAIIMVARWAGWMLWLGGFGGRDRDESAGSALGAILLIVLAPIAAMLIQMAISRAREYLADEVGARITRKPLELASALKKITEARNVGLTMNVNPATSHLWIINPLRPGALSELFSTHPPVEKRIERLKKIARELGYYIT